MASKVASLIRKHRDRLDWSDAELARRLGVSKSTVHDWIHGEHEPNLESLRHIAKVFGVGLVEFLEAA